MDADFKHNMNRIDTKTILSDVYIWASYIDSIKLIWQLALSKSDTHKEIEKKKTSNNSDWAIIYIQFIVVGLSQGRLALPAIVTPSSNL